ncbi:hypothetical protein Zmor_003202 [Zophobas morio]|uniref:Uncharacterized protein n=1 Tax=Zophobas morio TaxID=2755281 RepID=A0AA38HLU8_9CUCU|nr:hypothetical protein Zmor_003202 [Zophobas morio]
MSNCNSANSTRSIRYLLRRLYDKFSPRSKQRRRYGNCKEEQVNPIFNVYGYCVPWKESIENLVICIIAIALLELPQQEPNKIIFPTIYYICISISSSIKIVYITQKF